MNADEHYATLDFNLGYSTYLEPLLRPSAWRDPTTELSSTLAHELALGVHGQYAFDYRLIPQASQIVGGLYSVRGYDQSVAVGDTVVVGSFEYRFHVPRILPVQREPMRSPTSATSGPRRNRSTGGRTGTSRCVPSSTSDERSATNERLRSARASPTRPWSAPASARSSSSVRTCARGSTGATF